MKKRQAIQPGGMRRGSSMQSVVSRTKMLREMEKIMQGIDEEDPDPIKPHRRLPSLFPSPSKSEDEGSVGSRRRGGGDSDCQSLTSTISSKRVYDVSPRSLH